MSYFSGKNYLSVNTISDASEKDWSLTGIFTKSLKQANVLLENGKEYKYASRWPFKEGDVAIIGNTLLQSYEVIEQSSNSGIFGVITCAEPKLTIKRSHAVELDYVFTENVSKKNITDCIKYMNSPQDFDTLQYGKFSENYFPLSFYIRRLLAASSIIAHPKIASAEEIEDAKRYICEIQDINEMELLVGPPEPAGLNFTDTQTDTKGEIEKYLEQLGIESEYEMYDLMDFSDEEYDELMQSANIYLNKYSYIGAVSIMIRGGFVNLLRAFLSAEPPIKDFYEEMIGYFEETGSVETMSIIRNYKPQK